MSHSLREYSIIDHKPYRNSRTSGPSCWRQLLNSKHLRHCFLTASLCPFSRQDWTGRQRECSNASPELPLPFRSVRIWPVNTGRGQPDTAARHSWQKYVPMISPTRYATNNLDVRSKHHSAYSKVVSRLSKPMSTPMSAKCRNAEREEFRSLLWKSQKIIGLGDIISASGIGVECMTAEQGRIDMQCGTKHG